jgi:dCMP deaminase
MTRPTMSQVWMTLAFALADRATCERAKVGAVLTDMSGQIVLGVGYNGNVKGGANGCDDPAAAGRCGCLHAEMNALLKAPGLARKTMFVSTAPCLMCAKAMVNANVARLVYHREYREPDGLQLLVRMNVTIEQGDGWLPGPSERLTWTNA